MKNDLNSFSETTLKKRKLAEWFLDWSITQVVFYKLIGNPDPAGGKEITYATYADTCIAFYEIYFTNTVVTINIIFFKCKYL
jgi:hypothetical protein